MIVRLVDMVLLVLFGFMCVSQVNDQVKVQLPVSSQIQVEQTERSESFSITVDLHGQYYVPGAIQPNTAEEVIAILDDQNEQWRHKGQVRVLIRADRGAPMSKVKELFRACSERDMVSSLVIVMEEK
ncbi:MAG: biopolymer transporter ExbD [bacterium]|nr:biopolymer transporter ExbD [bacterium]